MKEINGKEEEKIILGELAQNDTYFRDAFGELNIQQMQRNITNDVPLLLNTGYISLTFREIRLIRHLLGQETLILQNKLNPMVVCEEQRKLNTELIQFMEKLNNKLETEG